MAVGRRTTLTVAVLAAAFAAVQCIRVAPSNPAPRGDLVAPPEVKVPLRRACFDCHSNETTWPWYSKVAPLSWVLAPTWGIKAIRAATLGGNPWPSIGMCVLLAAIYLAIGSVTLRNFERLARSRATLSLT